MMKTISGEEAGADGKRVGKELKVAKGEGGGGREKENICRNGAFIYICGMRSECRKESASVANMFLFLESVSFASALI